MNGVATLVIVIFIFLILITESIFLYFYFVKKNFIKSISYWIRYFISKGNTKENQNYLIDELSRTLQSFSKSKIGALFIVQGTDSLIDFIDAGYKIECDFNEEISTSLLSCKTSPIHDGAIIIVGSKIKTCSCYVPITTKTIKIGYGARHRAAIGVSELYDCTCFVVSETSGAISIIKSGEIETFKSLSNIEENIQKALTAKA